MAITITWGTRVINVPKDDLALVQPYPEVRELDLNWFRQELKGLEDDPEGMPFPDTHSHNTEVTLSGLTYARIVEIINGYTVEFEDDQYTVNCVGANHNLSDVKVANQVSLIVNNAAGLINNAAIEYSSFGGGVTVDLTSSYTGTTFPVGTPQRPVNNFSDALQIASVRGFTTFYVVGDATVDDSLDYGGFIFVGESQTKTELDVESNAQVDGCEFYDATVVGTLDGDAKIKNCTIGTLNYINGVIEQCLLEVGTITLGGSLEAHFLDCWSGVAGTNTPTIDMGGSGQELSLRNYNGGIKIVNKSGSDPISIDLNSGHIILDTDVTNGTIVIRGVGKLTDNSIGADVNIQDLVNPGTVADAVLDEVVSDHSDAGSVGLHLTKLLGLAQENFRIKDQSYSYIAESYHLTSATLSIYPNATDCTNDTNSIEEYTITATYDANGNCTSYRVTN